MQAKSRKRTVYVKAEESRTEKLYKWSARLWPLIFGVGFALWAISGEWRDYSTIKSTVGHSEPAPTGLVKKVGDLDGKVEKLSDGQKETHSILRELTTQVNRVATGGRKRPD